MRFKKGSKVEVLNNREVPSGSWWEAEIISGNGHNYYVSYDQYSPNIGATVERVPRKAIRPCPPSVDARSWGPGDIVEVFDNYSWKCAEVSRIIGGKYFYVRLLGSSREFRAHISDIRLRQSWQDNNWIVIGEGSGKCNNGMINILSKEGKFSCQMPLLGADITTCVGDDYFPIENDNGFGNPNWLSTRGTKRRPHFCSPSVKTCTGAGGKIRAVEKEGKRQRLVAELSSQLLEKVDAVASPLTVLGEKYMHASLNNRTTGFSAMDTEGGKSNGDVGYFFSRSLEPSDAESTSSSVGSCSPSNSPCRSFHHPRSSPIQDIGRESDDTESFCGSGREPSLPSKEVLAVEIHQLELHAYHTTMVALHASGPISWEQEELMTNLRLMLHISIDEHIFELKHLVSAETGISLS